MTGPEVGLKKELPEDDLDGWLPLGAQYVRVYRLHENSGRKTMCGTVDRDLFSADLIMRRWGGGRFKLQALDGKKAFLEQTTCEIEGEPRKWNGSDSDSPSSSAPAPADARLDKLEGAVADVARLLGELRNPPAAAATADPVAMVVSIVTAMQTATAPLITALLETRSPKGMSPEAMLRMFSMGLRFAEKRGRPDMLERAIDEIGVPLMEVVTGKRGIAGAPAPGPDGVPAAPAAAAAPNGAPPAPAWVVQMTPWIDFLMERAEADRNPATYAELFDDSAEPAQRAGILHLLAQGEAFHAEFFRWFPAVQPWRHWFLELFSNLQTLNAPDGDATPDD